MLAGHTGTQRLALKISGGCTGRPPSEAPSASVAASSWGEPFHTALAYSGFSFPTTSGSVLHAPATLQFCPSCPSDIDGLC